ncbi:MAG: methylamine dehydrogenase [Alphaproteobacteria bacterium]|nr:MAG: methylamine dehydrogenase [Alphaproteobacteria bacterium]
MSQVLLWVLVVGLGLAVLALARQVGVLYERVAPAGALAVNQSLKAGDKAPTLTVTTLDGKSIDLATATGRSRLLFFLAPDCPICKTLLPAVRSLARDEGRDTDIILASDGEPAVHRLFIDKEKLGGFDYVLSEALGRAFGVAKLPYAVLIDGKGVIVSFGIVNSREHLESLIEARDRGVASIQDYMNSDRGDRRLDTETKGAASGIL